MTTTVTTEVLEGASERLQAPATSSSVTSDPAWPFLPRAMAATDKQTTAQQKLMERRATLLRTSSFVKLRKYCNQSHALNLLKTSSSALQAAVNTALLQLKAVALVLAVYTCVIALVFQAAYCFYALTGKAAPPGLVFMVTSVLAIIIAYMFMILDFTKRNKRSVKRVSFVYMKKIQ